MAGRQVDLDSGHGPAIPLLEPWISICDGQTPEVAAVRRLPASESDGRHIPKAALGITISRQS